MPKIRGKEKRAKKNKLMIGYFSDILHKHLHFDKIGL